MVATGISMGPSGDPACELPDYAPEANGIVPATRDIPRARDKYGGSAHLGSSVADHGVGVHMGPQIGHEKHAALGNKFGMDGLPLSGNEIEPRFDNYKQKVQGVMPGYGGFRPGARDECGAATFGGIKRFGQGQNRGAHEAPKPDFVPQVRGVLPGYTGYVPTSKNTHGVSHYGGIAGGHHNMPASGPQKGHGNAVKGDKMILAKPHVKAGYSGHIPAARDTFGGSHYGVGSHLSPDDYDLENKLAGTGTKMSDFRLITGSTRATRTTPGTTTPARRAAASSSGRPSTTQVPPTTTRRWTTSRRRRRSRAVTWRRRWRTQGSLRRKACSRTRRCARDVE